MRTAAIYAVDWAQQAGTGERRTGKEEDHGLGYSLASETFFHPIAEETLPELLKAADVQNLRTFLPFERNSGENGPNFVFLAQSNMYFMAFSVHVPVQNFILKTQSAQKIFQVGKCQLSPVTCHLSSVTCHLSSVTCHLSPVTCHLSPVTCH